MFLKQKTCCKGFGLKECKGLFTPTRSVGVVYERLWWSISSRVIFITMDRATTTLPCVIVCLFLFLRLPAHGQTSSKAPSGDPQKAGEDKDPIAIVELGAATSWNLSGGAATFAPNLAAEETPIENWLEIEAGVSPFYTRKSTEWDTDLLSRSRGPYHGRQSS